LPEHLFVCEVGIASARIGDYKHGDSLDRFVLQTAVQGAAGLYHFAENHQADGSNYSRAVLPDFPQERAAAAREIFGPKIAGARSRTADQVRDPQAVAGQVAVIRETGAGRKESGVGHQAPELVRVAREVMPYFGRAQSRIQPDEQDPAIVRDPVRQLRKNGDRLLFSQCYVPPPESSFCEKRCLSPFFFYGTLRAY
jgi:hypothetical protein